MECYAAIKKKELLPFVTEWVDLEIIIVSEISQSVKNKYHMILLIVQTNDQNKFTKQKRRHGYMEQTASCERRGGEEDWMKGEGISQRTCMPDPRTHNSLGIS